MQIDPEGEIKRLRENVYSHECAALSLGWRVSNNPLPNKERIKLPRQKMPEQLAQLRAHNFQKVSTGFGPEQARQLRCIKCNQPGCMNQCPVSVDVRAVMDLIVAGDYLGAAPKVREENALPAITGRVCPVEDQCEAGCILGRKGEPVGIAYLERFVADWERQSGWFGLPTNIARTGRNVGGDIVTGGSTVILAMGAGRKAAESINEYLRSLDGAPDEMARPVAN